MLGNKVYSLQFTVYSFLCALLTVHCTLYTICYAQDTDLELTLDANASTIPLPKIFKPNIDLSGRGLNRQTAWPQSLSQERALEAWAKDIGFPGIYRLQFNLWEIHQLARDKNAQGKLLENYEKIIKNISDAGGIVILDIFGTPAGLGRILDKRTPPIDFKAYKELVKGYMRDWSVKKRYSIWYEAWSAPDLDDFFLGRKQDYFNLYRALAQGVLELEQEAKVHIPIGGPSVSWWFQDIDGNTIITPEKSLIYGLIKFCSAYKLPLNFISWHGYSTSPKIESERTRYKKSAVELIREWLKYFGFEKNMPLIVDEWNFDTGLNVSPERQEKSYIAASYLPSRLKRMYEAGIDNQVWFSLEDFFNQKEGVVRNVGAFWFDFESSEHKGGAKAIYNAFRMLNKLGESMFLAQPKAEDEFVGVVATKSEDGIALLVYNYIDPEIARNYLARNIATLNDAERKVLLNLFKTGGIENIFSGKSDIARLRASNKLKTLLKKAQELNAQADKFKALTRNLKLAIKNLNGKYTYQRYTIDSSCSMNCEFKPVEEKEIQAAEVNQQDLSLRPYSVHLLILKKKIEEPEAQAQ